jgi:xanthine/uracil permease
VRRDVLGAYACGFWLILLGIFGKIAGVITSIPDCVLGGMTIFLFSNVLISGIALTKHVDLDSRRNRFIMAFSMALGVGVTVWPYAFLDRRASPYSAPFWKCADCSNAMKGLRNGLSIFLSTGYCGGSVAAMILHGILPSDIELAYAEDEDDLVLTEINEKNDALDESDEAESKYDNDFDKEPSGECYAKEIAIIEDA